MADLISRAYILEALGHFNDYVNGDPHFLNGIETAKEITENAPAVDAVPVVHGRWIDEEGNPVQWCNALPSSPAVSCWCDQCGTWLVASDEYPVYGLFCPACGAKMDGERRDDDAAD